MKQIWPTYAYSPTTNVLTLTGLNIDRDQLLLVTAADRGRIMYNFADSSVTASAFTSGANTALTLVATTAGLTTTAALVIYYDDQLASTTVTVSSLPAISGTVTAQTDLDTSTGQPCIVLGYGTPAGMSRVTYNNAFPVQILNTTGQITSLNPLPISGTVTIGSALPAGTNRIGSVTASGTVTIGNNITLLGNQSSGLAASVLDGAGIPVYFRTSDQDPAGGNFPISGTVTIGSALPAGTNRIGVVTIGGGTVTIGAGTAQIGSVTASISNFPATQAVSLTTLPALVAGTAQIGSVTASISGTVPISISSVTVGNSVTIGSLPALAAGTAQIGSVTASISNTAITVYSAQGTTVTNSNFTSTTASTTLVSAVAGRDVLTVFNEGAGNLHISPGATCTTVAYQVRLSSGDYWECPEGQLSLAHTAVFATAGTARVTEVS